MKYKAYNDEKGNVVLEEIKHSDCKCVSCYSDVIEKNTQRIKIGCTLKEFSEGIINFVNINAWL